MTFYEHAKRIIAEKLGRRQSFDEVIYRITHTEGKVAFYPCSRLCRELARRIKETEPGMMERVIGCFDKADEVGVEEGVTPHGIRELDAVAGDISLLVVASNNFYTREMDDLAHLTNYRGPVLNISRFETVPSGYGDT